MNGASPLVLTAPQYVSALVRPAIFLAGGITDCPPWQQEAVDLFTWEDMTLFNPRRENFPIGDPQAAPKQITWEHTMLREADAILFWFCAESIQPIVLFELGAWSMTTKPIFVGAHPDYPRRLDVEWQIRLARPELQIWATLEDTVANARAWIAHDWWPRQRVTAK